MKNNIFTFSNDKLFCWRLGPVNAQKQRHYSRDVPSNGLLGTHKPPISRGFWAFPYPHYDFFFCFHQWEKHLPKKYKERPEVYNETWEKEREILLKEIRNKFKPSTFYTKEFYSHIFPNGRCDYEDWFFWDSPRQWGKVAQKTLIDYYNFGNGLSVCDTTKDHLEIFVP